MLPVAILAGGLATRMRPLTEKIPKALLEVNGEPFIAHQLRLLKRNNIIRIVICAGFLSEMLQDYVKDGSQFGVHVQYSFEGRQLLGTGGALRRALPLLGDAFSIIYGDSYLDCDYAAAQAAFLQSGKLALMTVFKNEGKWDKSNVEYANGQILAYDKRQQTPRMHYIDYGLSLMKKEAIVALPENEPYDLADVYQALLKQNELAAYEVHQRFYEIGSFTGLEEFSLYIKANNTI